MDINSQHYFVFPTHQLYSQTDVFTVVGMFDHKLTKSLTNANSLTICACSYVAASENTDSLGNKYYRYTISSCTPMGDHCNKENLPTACTAKNYRWTKISTTHASYLCITDILNFS